MFRDFLHYERRLAPLTTRAYVADVRQFLDAVAATDGPVALAAIGPSHVRAYLAERSGAGAANVTLARKLTALRTFFGFAVEHLGSPTDPTALLQAPKKPHRLPPAVDGDRVVDWLQSSAFGPGFPGQRDLAIVMTLYLLGLRRAELLSLRVGDVADGQTEVRITGKRSKTRLLPVVPALRRQWDHYLGLRAERFGDSPPDGEAAVPEALFLTDRGRPMYPKAVYGLVRKHLEGADWVEGRSPHLLRHAFASHLMDGGADLRSVQELMGHASLSSTQVYLHASAKRLLEVYRGAHPKARGR